MWRLRCSLPLCEVPRAFDMSVLLEAAASSRLRFDAIIPARPDPLEPPGPRAPGCVLSRLFSFEKDCDAFSSLPVSLPLLGLWRQRGVCCESQKAWGVTL